MADKKKMSVAEMLAAARKADGDGGAQDSTPEPEAPEAEVASAEKSTAKRVPAKPIAKPGSAERPSAADILAMARAGKGGGEKPAAAKTQAKAKASAKKQAPAKKPAAAKKQAEPRDTASILASARKSSKPGPMSKAEAAAKSPSGKGTPAKAKPKIIVPPMPVKPAYAQPATVKKSAKAKGAVDEDRRSFLGVGFWTLGGVCAVWTLATVKFMFPNVLREPPSKFKVGLPDSISPGQVQTKYKAQFAVWVTNTTYHGQQQLVALKSVCTHLGCTPNWLEAEQKFKCPCHGSGFYQDGINFEGPAPRPLERYAIRIADDGQVEIDKSQIFQEEMGQWKDPACFISV